MYDHYDNKEQEQSVVDKKSNDKEIARIRFMNIAGDTVYNMGLES